MKPSDFQKTIQCQFDCKLKRTVKGVIWNYKKELKRRKDKEIPFCELPEIVVEKLAVWDEYMSDYTVFEVCGVELHRPNIVGFVAVFHPKPGLAVFSLSNRQNHSRR